MKPILPVAFFLLACTSAFASDDARLKASTSAAATIGADGALDTTVSERLLFHVSGKPDLMMPYLSITEFQQHEDVSFHLGFFPAMFWGMVAPRPKVHTLTVSYRDEAGAIQVATFELSKHQAETIEPVLYARALKACVRREYGSCMPVVSPPPGPRVPLVSRQNSTSTAETPAVPVAAAPEPPAPPPAP